MKRVDYPKVGALHPVKLCKAEMKLISFWVVFFCFCGVFLCLLIGDMRVKIGDGTSSVSSPGEEHPRRSFLSCTRECRRRLCKA